MDVPGKQFYKGDGPDSERMFEMHKVKDLLPKIMNDFNNLKKEINR